MGATFTPIQGQPGQYIKQEVVTDVDLDSSIAVDQKEIDDNQTAIDDYKARIQVRTELVAIATQRRDAKIAAKTSQQVTP